MAAHVKNHTTAATNNKKFGEKLGTIGRLESYDKLKEVFTSVSGANEKVADARMELLGEGAECGGYKLLGRLEDTCTGVIKPSKALLADRSQKVKAVDKEVKGFDSLKSKASKAAANEIKKKLKEAAKKGLDPPTETPEHAAEVASAAVEMPESLLDARETLKNTEKLVDKSSFQYEERRIVDMQLFIEDFIRREIAWHAKAMEILSPLIAEVRKVDANGAIGSFNTRLERVNTTEKDELLNVAEQSKRASMGEGGGGAKEDAEMAAEASTAKEAADGAGWGGGEGEDNEDGL